MTTVILVGGLIVTLLVAIAMRRPEWRLPALLFAILAIPGNVDNLMPQMRLDPNALPNNTAPVISFVDVLIVWSLALAYREGRLKSWPRAARWAAGLSAGFALLATVVTAINVSTGVDPGAAVRGVITLARVPALVMLAIAHRDLMADGRRIAIGTAFGLVALLGNGLFTSNQLETTRFTAATLGRNGFALALVVASLVVAGLAVETWRGGGRRDRLLAMLAFALAGAALFGAIATGTRMALLAAVPAIIVALAVNRTWWSRAGVMGLAAIVAGTVLIGAGATMWTAAGGRAISVVTDPGDTVDIITNPEGEPDYSPVRTRTKWWNQAFAMVRVDPLTGVGPYQWNVHRYDIDPEAIEVVADPHNTYIQMATEYGLVVLAGYLILVGGTAVAVLLTVWRRAAATSTSAIATAIAAAGLMIPITELTNSHLFNVRLGAAAWLLLGVALTLTVIPVTAPRTSAASLPGSAESSPRARDPGSQAARNA